MSDDKPGYFHQRVLRHLEGIDLEIAQMAIMCDVPLLNPGVIERVLSNDSTVCGKDKPKAFEKLRALLVMHYVVRDRVVDRLGQQEAVAMGAEILAHLKGRIGEQLGGTPGMA
jgi:hypothetical protein